MMAPAALRQLLRLAEARKASDLARLDALMVARRAVEAEIVEARATAVADLTAIEGLPMEQRAIRLIWADQRAKAGVIRREALDAEIAAARAAAVQSLGKHEALGKLVEKADRDAGLARVARKERETPG